MSDNENKDYGIKKALVNKPLAWQDLALSEQVKGLRFFRDAENNIVVFAVMPFDPTQTGLNVLPLGRVGISDPLTLNAYARVYGLPCCGWPETTLGLVTHSTKMVQKNTNLEAQRTPTVFRVRTGIIDAGNTAVWTPVAGNRFRLMGGVITISKDAACAGALLISLLDLAVNIFSCDVSSAALVATGQVTVIPFTFHQNGYLSADINQALNCSLSAALTAGRITVSVYGTEEV